MAKHYECVNDKPAAPPPSTGQQEPEKCHVQLEGYVDCCCPGQRLQTRLVQADFNGSDAQLKAQIATLATNYTNAGYILQGINVLDVGGGWQIGMIVGWYV